MAKVPVVLLFYNRPALLAKVWSTVRAYEPSTLFLVGDGPKTNCPNDEELVAAARALVDKIDWPCIAYRKYSQENLGCRRNVSEGLTWVFEHSEMAIILEDDCIADATFFEFCEELLAHYDNDSSVMSICGYNPWAGLDATGQSYGISRYPHLWGWATWKRAWNLFDGTRFLTWNETRGSVYETSKRSDVRRFWKWVTTAGPKSSWGYQWILTCLMNKGRSIIPSRNLVSNEGFGENSTHTKTLRPAAQTQAMPFPLKHDQVAEHFSHYEKAIEDAHFTRKQETLLRRFRRYFASVMKKLKAMRNSNQA